MVGGRDRNSQVRDRAASVATWGSEQFPKRLLNACALGDVRPNVTTKLMHFSLSYFDWVTVTTCDDEREGERAATVVNH